MASLDDLRPGDIMFTDISGAPGFGIWLGEKILKESFEIGPLRVCHVGIVTQAATSSGRSPRLVQAMMPGAEEVDMTPESYWTSRHVYARLPEDYPGQAQDAATIARAMVTYHVGYSIGSYFALAAWSWGLKVDMLEKWIDRRQPSRQILGPDRPRIQLPCEAICSVLADQAWSLAGKRVMQGVAHQAVTPGAMAGQLFRRRGVTWFGDGLDG